MEIPGARSIHDVQAPGVATRAGFVPHISVVLQVGVEVTDWHWHTALDGGGQQASCPNGILNQGRRFHGSDTIVAGGERGVVAESDPMGHRPPKSRSRGDARERSSSHPLYVGHGQTQPRDTATRLV